MTDLQQVKESIKAVAKDYWDTHKKPLLLSNLPPVLEAKAPNFKSILGSQNIKSFIKDYATEMDVRLIEHATHKAKVAVAPLTATFDFPTESTAESKNVKTPRSALKGDKAVLALLHSLSSLSDEDLDRVSIPVSVLVKMIK
ncbi:hypothetical protein [Pseudomonas syringae group genomosp. 3]|uniref:hypothetical protein n=1 Tax=Pseudomonas syringae group genomosp. 3 TaxID=251701 RepID=UPI0006E4B097|nr:hypothetical protein [Pseudomonas syringae group genomosp. 3]KPW57628.1 hypothetical protein ALO86_200205 [Pseudomonas syringae pv. berberidis]KPY15061.1 Uncharacterized protein ALO54_00361 [Pseudomonas syringae pv. philadelphi]RMM24236.1 hypothetical protein ALQ83_04131 [Pseudomonas syringae pv. berberidis]RMP60014.1 hypothetical protein ALQ19_01229 [Pseudomonas syringae pv. berberidis]RMQ31862.1 hypothetical protein ALQ06_200158 [Pseudomonas syringae pv. berberidis]